MPVLAEISESATPRTFSITTDRFVMGRGPESDLQAVFAESKGVSRQHALIHRIEGQYYLEDLQSRNGTTLNGQKIAARQLLQDGDRIGICEKLFCFQDQAPVDRTPSLPAVTDGGLLPQLLASVPLPSAETAAASAVTNAQRKLQAILGLLNQLGQSLEVEVVLSNLVEGLLRVFPKADQTFAGLLSEDVRLTSTAFRSRGTIEGEMRISRTLIHHVVRAKSAILSAHLETDPRFESSQTIGEMNCESLMCAPLVDNEGLVFGIVQLGRMGTTAQRRVFDEQDLEVLASVATQAGITLRFAQAHAQALLRQALDQDLKLARRVQLGILPSQVPTIDPYQFFNYYEAAYEVGGDYYDYVALSGSRMGVIVADVSGKSVSAALLMAKVAGELRYFLSSQPTVADAVAKMNESLCNSNVAGRYLTLLVAVLDPTRHEVNLVNAGHLHPLLRLPDGSVQPVVPKKRGAAIGLFAGSTYEEQRLLLLPGAALVLYTDGFSEAANGAGELYGNERLIEQMRHAAGGVAELGKTIVSDVQRFIAGQRQSDDMCLVCFGHQR